MTLYAEDDVVAMTSGSLAGRRLHVWSPEDPRAVVLALHGGLAHAGDWVTPALFLRERAVATVAPELTGHDGRRRVDVPGFDVFLDDAQQTLAWIAARWPGRPVFLMGHSMGALIATHLELGRFAHASEIAGVILSSPYYVNAIQVSPLLLKLSRLLAALVPRAKVPMEPITEHLTHDTAISARHREDEREGRRATEASLRFARALVDAQEALAARGLEAWRHPVFAVLAGDDRLADVAGARALLGGIPEELLELHEYPHNYHENFNELNREEIFALMVEWMGRQVDLGSVAHAPLAGPSGSVASANGAVEAGAPASPVLDRVSLLRSLVDTRGLGLEIGPGFNPLLPKAEGFNVRTLDHATRAELVAKYAGAAVDTSRIEEVDHVWRGGSLVDVVGEEGVFDYIVASHVIEHTPDLLGFLLDCQRLLKPAGVLALAVPDKRCSFDALRPLSSTGEVLQAHLEGRRRHPPGRVFDEVAYNVLRGGDLAWNEGDTRALAFAAPLDKARALFDHAAAHHDEFIDIHAWQFTPSSFRLIAEDLHGAGFLALRELHFHGDRGGEFIVALSARGPGSGLSRLALAQAAIEEQRRIAVAPLS